MRLHRQGNRQWRLSSPDADGPEAIATYSSDDLRFSLSRKAYCFADQRHYETWLQGVDPLVPEVVLRTLTDALVERGALDPTKRALTDGELAALLITEFIDFPSVADSP